MHTINSQYWRFYIYLRFLFIDKILYIFLKNPKCVFKQECVTKQVRRFARVGCSLKLYKIL